MRARFDDLRPAHVRSFGFAGLTAEIVAHRVDDVVAAVESAEAAAAGGAWVAGFVAYEAAPAFDPVLRVHEPDPGGWHAWLPLVWFGVFERRVDHLGGPDTGSYAIGEWMPTVDRAGYDHAVERIREHIRIGDTYQVNYSMRLRAAFSGDTLAFYRDLCAAQSGGFGAYLDAGRFRVLSASPELFFEWSDDELTTRPMKGTAPRGRWPEEDAVRRDELMRSEKDRAENVMIVDLLRNDLGRVARFGTVRVDSLFEPERYDTVWQLTSTVRANVAPHVGVTDVFGALFPCGSVTGAPKVRTMEIIRDAERDRRGVYTGAIGYLAPPGAPGPRAAFSVAIRTVVVDAEDGDAEYGVGGGIVWDSSSEAEYEEAMVKARVLTRSRTPFRLLETLRWDPGAGFDYESEHLERMAASAAYFGIPFDIDVVRKTLHESVSGPAPRRVRLLVDRSGGVEAESYPLESPPTAWEVAIDHDPIDAADPFLYHKTTHRAVYDLRKVRHPGADDVLLVNERGELTESTVANLLVRIDGRWLTPPVESGCLPGVARQALLEAGLVDERVIRPEHLAGAEEIQLVNSVRGRIPISVGQAGREGIEAR